MNISQNMSFSCEKVFKILESNRIVSIYPFRTDYLAHPTGGTGVMRTFDFSDTARIVSRQNKFSRILMWQTFNVLFCNSIVWQPSQTNPHLSFNILETFYFTL